MDHHRNTNVARFGFNSLDQQQFGRSICKIITTGNFVSYPAMLRAAIDPFMTFPELYEGQLKRTFGQSDSTGNWNITDFASDMTGGSTAPYWVINATFVEPYAKSGWAEGLMEFTPLQKGNNAYGYSRWSQGQQLSVVKAVAISGAAARVFLNQRIPNLIDGVTQQTIKLSDGGHSENLGAVALIRRGVKTVIVGDAEHDSDYTFGAYTNLKSRLNAWNLVLTIPELDEYLSNHPAGGSARHGLYKGVVTDKTGNKKTDIFYLKMSRPAVVEAIVKQDLHSMPGASVSEKYFTQLRNTTGAATSENPNGVWDCNHALPVTREEMSDWFKYSMASQYQSAQRSWRLRLTRSLNMPGIYSDFPMHSTGDQSYYLDQSMGYVGLGYIEAEFLRPYIDQLRRQ